MAEIFHHEIKISKADVPSPPEDDSPRSVQHTGPDSATGELRRRLLEIIKQSEARRRQKKRVVPSA